MNDKSTLVAYVTKGKATEEAAELISQVLRDDFGLSVELVNLKGSSPDIEDYNNVIIGAGVRMGRVYKRALKFMEKDFSGKNVAVFLSSLEGSDEKSHEEAIENSLTPVRLGHSISTLKETPVIASAPAGSESLNFHLMLVTAGSMVPLGE